MARTADRRKDLRRKKQHRALKPNKAPVSELSPKSRRWRTVVLGVGGDSVEDVDQHQEQGHQEGHPAGDDVHGDEE